LTFTSRHLLAVDEFLKASICSDSTKLELSINNTRCSKELTERFVLVIDERSRLIAAVLALSFHHEVVVLSFSLFHQLFAASYPEIQI